MTRIKSLHHNLGDKNVIFHREYRTKKGQDGSHTDKSYKKLKKLKDIKEKELREIDDEIRTFKAIDL